VRDLARSLEDRDGADGACGATADLEWKADEAESTAPYQLVEIGKAFHVCDRPLATCEMGLEVRFAFGGRAHRLHTKHADAPVGQPMHAFHREAGKIME